MKVSHKKFGITKDGQEVTAYTLKNDNGMEVTVLDFGAVVTSIVVPDKNRNMADVVLGYESLDKYEVNDPSFGGFIGRHANRIANAEFTLNEKIYHLQKNNGENNLHGGDPHYRRQMYEAEVFDEDGASSVEFSRLSPDMEQGFPGNFDVTVTYTLSEENEFMIEYSGVSDKDTVVNLTNHSYFNLAGHNTGSVLEHKVRIYANQFTPTDDSMIPTGEYRDVEGTPMDFREMKTLGQDIKADYVPLKQGNGYDHNFVLNKQEGKNEVELAAEYWDEKSGRFMEVFTDLPGMQLYTANWLDEKEGCKENAVYHSRDAVCFETQFYPNACNTPQFPTSVLKAEEEYNHVTIYKFSIK